MSFDVRNMLVDNNVSNSRNKNIFSKGLTLDIINSDVDDTVPNINYNSAATHLRNIAKGKYLCYGDSSQSSISRERRLIIRDSRDPRLKQ